MGYEEIFIDKILSKIPEISPNDVIPQYHFVDDKGKNRYIDFMIINQVEGYYLPIELDGTYKDVDHNHWKDFLVRQNSLITKFGIVLRFSNKHMLNEPMEIIHKIRETLTSQKDKNISEADKQKERENLASWYNERLNELKVENQNSEDISNQIQELKNLIKETGNPRNDRSKEQSSKESATSKNNFWFGVSSALIGIIVVWGVSTKSELIQQKELLEPSMQVKVTTPDVEIENTLDSKLVSSLASNDSGGQSKRYAIDSWEEVPADEIKSSLGIEKHYPDNAILSSKVSRYVGLNKTVCGQVVQVKEFSKGFYLNFEKPFPNMSFSSVIWDSNVKNVLGHYKSFNEFLDKNACVEGKISTYNNQIQIVVDDSSQIEIY
ncbi:hypothetical protein NCCP2140_31590 [Pseudoalteromonas sp. NCCP-2140]|nr:hypothetical protein NCCP2140_31590 [Pseudoalteromonas sp. NCCP-2140]